MVAEISTFIPVPDGYDRVLLEVAKYKDSTISVPALSRLLGVKPTTINARFRREGVHANTIGRTNYIPGNVALMLVQRHQYALQGWPTLHEVSRATGIKAGTLKARCEKGKLESHVDLTKRLRVNPAEAAHLTLERHNQPAPQPQFQSSFVRRNDVSFSKPVPRTAISKPAATQAANIFAPARRPFTLPPAPEPRVQVLTARDYGMEAGTVASRNAQVQPVKKHRGALDYNPERPFSIKECSVGKTVYYEKYDGTITKLIHDPFNPAIQVAFPNHVEPLMRDILLRVAR